MTENPQPTIVFDTSANIEERPDCWAAHINSIGMICYADTENGVSQRAGEAIEFFLENTPDVQQYLDAHDIPYRIIGDPTEP